MPVHAPLLTRLTAVSVLALVVLAACGGSDDDVTASTVTTAAGTSVTTEASTTTSRAPTTTRAATTTAAASTTAASTTVAASGLAVALLTPGDLPGEFTAAPGEPGDLNAPTPCGTPKAEKLVPSQEQARTELTSTDGQLLLDQAVFRYADEVTAAGAMPIGLAGLSCLQGTTTADDGTTSTFDLQALDLPATLGDDRFAFGGTLQQGSSNLQVIFVALRDGALISTMTFVALPEAASPDAGPIVQTAADRLAQVV